MTGSPKKKQSGWDRLDPDLLAFARGPVYEEPAPGGFPLPEELLRDRREWAKILEEQPLLPAGQSADAKQDGAPTSETAADRLIGPRNSDHPHVNTKPGGRGLA